VTAGLGQEVSDLRDKVGGVEGSQGILLTVVKKLDETVEFLREISSNLVKNSAVHEERFRHVEATDERILKAFEAHTADDIKRFEELRGEVKAGNNAVLEEVKANHKEFKKFKRTGWIALGGVVTVVLLAGGLVSKKFVGIVDFLASLVTLIP
jgi:hypothetical protein